MSNIIDDSINPTALRQLLFRYSIENSVEFVKNSTYRVAFPDNQVRFIRLGESGDFDELIDLYSNYQSFEAQGNLALPEFFEKPEKGTAYLFFDSAITNNTTKNLIFTEGLNYSTYERCLFEAVSVYGRFIQDKYILGSIDQTREWLLNIYESWTKSIVEKEILTQSQCGKIRDKLLGEAFLSRNAQLSHGNIIGDHLFWDYDSGKITLIDPEVLPRFGSIYDFIRGLDWVMFMGDNPRRYPPENIKSKVRNFCSNNQIEYILDDVRLILLLRLIGIVGVDMPNHNSVFRQNYHRESLIVEYLQEEAEKVLAS